MNYRCEGQVVEFNNIEYGTNHSILFREGFDYVNTDCNFNACDEGFIEINNLCFHQGDISVLQVMIDNSYASGIDLGCQDGDNYCGSPNPYMDDQDAWFWVYFG